MQNGGPGARDCKAIDVCWVYASSTNWRSWESTTGFGYANWQSLILRPCLLISQTHVWYIHWWLLSVRPQKQIASASHGLKHSCPAARRDDVCLCRIITNVCLLFPNCLNNARPCIMFCVVLSIIITNVPCAFIDPPILLQQLKGRSTWHKMEIMQQYGH